MAQVTNLTVEAGREAVLRCTSSSSSTSTSSSPASELMDKNEEEEKASKMCKWELDGKEIELGSTRHSLSSFDESHVSKLDHLTVTLAISHTLGIHSFWSQYQQTLVMQQLRCAS